MADRLNNRVQQFTGAGVFVRKWGSFGTSNGVFLRVEGAFGSSGGKHFILRFGHVF